MSGEGAKWEATRYRPLPRIGEGSRVIVQQVQQGVGRFQGQPRTATESCAIPRSIGGTLLVVGSAPCLFEDVERALAIRPFSALMLVNGACTAIENAEYVLAGHEEKASFFARERRAKFPNAPPWDLLATGPLHKPLMMKALRSIAPEVTQWFPHEIGVGATSASKAAKLGFILGFDEVILCGCPLDQPGYFPGEAKVPQHVHCARIGDHSTTKHFVTPPHKGEYSTKPGELMKVQELKIIRAYRERFVELAQGDFKGKVFSMSGFTREQLGGPPEVI